MKEKKKSSTLFKRVSYFIKYKLTIPFKALYYFFYFMKYPFWQPRNVWTGKKYWTFSCYDAISPGWRKAFGEQLTKDLKAVLKKEKQLKSFYFLEIKEKWGYLQLYSNPTTEEVLNLLNYYKNLSICYCEDCGKPARYTRLGNWIGYVCADCFNKQLLEWKPKATLAEKRKLKAKHRLKVEDIPDISVWVDGIEKIADIGINYKKMWAIRNKNYPANEGVKKK